MRPVFALLALACLSGCATFFRDGNQKVTITTNVSQATVFVDGREAGAGNGFWVYLDTTKDHYVEAKAPGYDLASGTFESTVHWGWVWLDAIVWFQFGTLVDYLSGSDRKLSPGHMTL